MNLEDKIFVEVVKGLLLGVGIAVFGVILFYTKKLLAKTSTKIQASGLSKIQSELLMLVFICTLLYAFYLLNS